MLLLQHVSWSNMLAVLLRNRYCAMDNRPMTHSMLLNRAASSDCRLVVLPAGPALSHAALLTLQEYSTLRALMPMNTGLSL
jgi:hypothetical protein